MTRHLIVETPGPSIISVSKQVLRVGNESLNLESGQVHKCLLSYEYV